MKNTIKCPYCDKEFEPTDALKHQIEQEVNAEAIEKHKKEIEQIRLLTEKTTRQKIENENSLELQDLKKALEEKDEKLSDFREKELELREKSRKLEEKEKDIELETQRRISEEKKKVEEDTSKRILEEHRYKDMEKDKQMSDMRKQIEDLKRISQQNSMQTQGEVGELDLQQTLEKLFPTDEITEFKKGELGGDVRQIVRTPNGNLCGLILWERKRTKSWDEKWVSKLKEDIRRDKAEAGIILTEALPKGFDKEIGGYNGIYIVTNNFVGIIAEFIRKNLYDIAKGKAIILNKQSKAEELYDFVTSQGFMQQIDKMSESYFAMKSQIAKERIAYEKLWKERELQIDNFHKGVANIWGGMKNIAGSALPQVKNLELDSGI
jgi:hypothetical protein